MISFGDILGIMFLAVTVYVTYWVRHAVEVYEHSKYSDYAAYKQSMKTRTPAADKPDRPQDRVGIHTIKGDKTKVTTAQANGLNKTADALVPLSEADPEDVMGYIDSLAESGQLNG